VLCILLAEFQWAIQYALNRGKKQFNRNFICKMISKWRDIALRALN
jgi:hypothetical protein